MSRVEEYCEIAGLVPTSTTTLIREIVNTKNGSGSLSYTRVMELLREKIQSLSYEPSILETHSFRAGGATLVVYLIGCLSVMVDGSQSWPNMAM